MFGTADGISVSIDTDIWTMPDEIITFIRQLNENDYSLEEKILTIFVSDYKSENYIFFSMICCFEGGKIYEI